MPQLKPQRGYIKPIDAHLLARGLVACWLMNEGTGGKIFDVSGNGLNLDFNNFPIWSPGKFGSSILFDDASSQYLEVNQAAVNGAPLTLLCWVYCNDLSQNTYVMYIADKDVTNNAFGIRLNADEAGSVQALTYAGTAAAALATVTMSANTWHQVCAVFVSPNDRRAYIDGGNEGTNISLLTPTGLNRTSIGRAGDSTPGYYMSGKVGFAMIWNRALSALEIAWLYREPFCMLERAIRPELIGSPIVDLAGTSTALSSLSATAEAIRKISGIVASTSDIAALLNSIRGVAGSFGGLAAVEGSLSITRESALEIEKSWLREALFNGMTANAFKLGTTLSLGWFWVRVAGCSVLYRGPSMEQIDFVNILTVAEQDACEISPPSYIPHNSSSTYFYVIRRFNNCGYQEHTLTAAVKVSIKSSGDLTEPQPNKISGSRAKHVDGNKIQLFWFYCPLEQKSQVVCFNVYHDGGMGQIDYENSIAIISYEGRKFYSHQSDALDEGRYLFAIRAEDAGGIENSSLAQLRTQLAIANPDAINILSAEAV